MTEIWGLFLSAMVMNGLRVFHAFVIWIYETVVNNLGNESDFTKYL